MDKNKTCIESDFRKFSSIENCVERHISTLRKYGFINDQDEWVAMEKIHGANFSFLTDGNCIHTAKRSGILTLDDNFYDHQLIAKKYEHDVYLIYQKIKLDIPDVTTVQIFGDIFGGYYPEPAKSVDNNQLNDHFTYGIPKRPVQKEVLYNNEIDFLVFDIKINKKTDELSITNETFCWYLSQDEIDTYLANLPLLRGVPVLARGKFNKMISMNPEFPTTIPMMYKLSPVDNNMAEGFVIKLNQRHAGNITRPIIKHKNKKFSEIGVKVPKNPSQNIMSNNKFIHKAIEYCTQNRFNNTISKIGPNNKIEKIQGIFIADAITDMKKDLDPVETEEFEKCVKKIKNDVSMYLFTNKITNGWLEEYVTPITEINY